MARKITLRAKAFSPEGVRKHNCLVDDDGTVRVYDPIAGYFTSVHSLSDEDIQLAIRKAAFN